MVPFWRSTEPCTRAMIGLADLTRRKQFGERGVGGVVLGDDDEAAGVFVETMNNAGPEVATGCRKRFEAKEQRVDESVAVACIFSFAGAGVHHHAGGLVDDGEVLVFEDDFERDVLRSGSERRGMRFAGDENLLATAEFERGFRLRAVDGDIALIEQQLHARSTDALKLCGDEVIETLTRGFGWDLDGAGLSHGKAFQLQMERIGAARWDARPPRCAATRTRARAMPRQLRIRLRRLAALSTRRERAHRGRWDRARTRL